MKTIKTHNGQLLMWHKSCQLHPIFNPNYARENLTSLTESVVLFSLYIFITIVFLHFVVLNDFLEKETITWLLVESGAKHLLFWAPNDNFLNKAYVLFVLGAALVAIIPIRRFFNIVKANFHPNSGKNLSEFLIKQNLDYILTKSEHAAHKKIRETKRVLQLKKTHALKSDLTV